MLDQLMEIIQQQGQSTVVENNAIPNEKNEAVMAEARNSIFKGLQDMMANGQADEVTSMLQSGKSEPAMNILSGNFIESITQKLGIDKATAMNIAASLIPMVISKLSNKAADPNDSSIDVGNILSSLRGGQGNSNIGGAINNIGGMFGLDKDKDGDVDLNDITKMF